ncbi:MAG: thiamine pyrophosphate-binding protein [Chloroflexi bacterium]|nr:thiamine pyrophosphate-binding protein [Chloroflexota bacterium]MDA1173262.1 thiamine pyrophosphate-binding protein [Chloroflexota bacterium]
MTESQQAGSLGKATPSNAVWGSDVMVDILRALGIKYIALNPGASYRGLHDSLVNYGDGGPEMLMCSHEEIAVAIANGYGRVTGKPMATGIHNVVGLQHAAMAIFNAWCDRTPILNLGGAGPQNATNRRSTDWVHTALVQGALVRDFVKFDDQPFSVEASMDSLLRAYRIATTVPMGPVYVALDSDVQEERLDGQAMIPDAANFKAPAPPRANLDALRDAAVMLAEAEWPVIIAGEISPHGTALDDLIELAELLGAAVVDTNRFSFPNTHDLDATQVREAVLKDADVVLALDVPSLGVPLGPNVRERGALQPAISEDCKIINIGMFEFEKQSWVTDNMWLMPVVNPIAAETTGAIRELLIMCREMRAMGDDFTAKAEARRAKVAAMHNEAAQKNADRAAAEWDSTPIAAGRFYGELKAKLAEREWALVHSHGGRWRGILDITEPDHELSGGRGGGVGSGLPTAIGGALAHKGDGKLCVGVFGDGDFFMTNGALWTAAKYDIPLLALIYNNESYYNDEDHQERMAIARDRPVENKGIGIRIEGPSPDFAMMARSQGVAGFGPVTNPNDLAGVLEEAIKVVESGKPAVVDIRTTAR